MQQSMDWILLLKKWFLLKMPPQYIGNKKNAPYSLRPLGSYL